MPEPGASEQERRNIFYPPRNFAALPQEFARFETARVLILPVPYDGSTTFRAGARDGPMAIIDASQYLELYDIELKRDIYQVGIHTLPEVEPDISGPEATVGRVYQVARSLLSEGHCPDPPEADEGRILVMLGGEHSLTVGAVRALRERYPDLSVLQLDAHADLRDSYLGARYSHASVGRRLLEGGPVTWVGVRSLSREEAELIEEQHLPVFHGDSTPLSDATIERIVATLSGEVYVTIDLDVFDPSIMAAVGTPEPGGLSWAEVLRVLRAVALSRRVLGFDLVELAPREGPVANAFLAAKLVYKLIGYLTQSD